MKHRGSFPNRIDTPDWHNGKRDVRSTVRSFTSCMEFDTALLRERARTLFKIIILHHFW